MTAAESDRDTVAGASVITPVTSNSGRTANRDAAPIFSALARTKVSAARRDSARFMAASSASPVVSPAGLDSRHADEKPVGGDILRGLCRSGSAGDHGVLEHAAEKKDLDVTWSASADANRRGCA